MYRGEADWSAIARAAKLVRQTKTFILGNGDLNTLAEVIWRVHESQVHGALVGRGTLGAPWFFRNKELARLAAQQHSRGSAGDLRAWEPTVSLSDRMALMLDHAKQYEAIAGTERFRSIRKHLGWYCKGFPHAAAMRAKMFQASSVADVEQVIAEICGNLAAQPPAPAASDTFAPHRVPQACAL
jgi:tRNA-dihydrouridine synthase